MQGGHGGPIAAPTRIAGDTVRPNRIDRLCAVNVAESLLVAILATGCDARPLHPVHTMRKPGGTIPARFEQILMNVAQTHTRPAAWPDRGFTWPLRAVRRPGTWQEA